MVTIDDVRAIAGQLPRSYEVLVGGRVKFRVGRIVYVSFSRDGALMGFGFPKEQREWLIGGSPEKFLHPTPSDMRYHWVQARLAALEAQEMRELVEDAWRMVVPKSVAGEYDERRRSMLGDKDTYASLPVSDLSRAREFYRDTLGIGEAMVTEGGVMYGSGSSRFFVYPSRYRGSGHTQMSWIVDDIHGEVAALRAKGITFEEFDMLGVTTVDGVSQVGPNVWTAWFKDPDGNLLGLTRIG